MYVVVSASVPNLYSGLYLLLKKIEEKRREERGRLLTIAMIIIITTEIQYIETLIYKGGDPAYKQIDAGDEYIFVSVNFDFFFFP